MRPATMTTLRTHERCFFPVASPAHHPGSADSTRWQPRNPRFGCPRIAQQINLTFGLDLDQDIIRRVLAIHYKPDPSKRGQSWLTTIGHAKDSLWSGDLFRCESIGPTFRLLKTHWVMVVMDHYTRRIIGFGVHAGNVDGPALCRIFNDATSGLRLILKTSF